MNKIVIATDFSVYPGGRSPDDGEFSGEEFREQFLVPAIESKQRTEIVFDGARGYGSSFLDESFGGLIRLGYKREDIENVFIFVSQKESFIVESNQYIEKANRKFQRLLKMGHTREAIVRAYKENKNKPDLFIENILEQNNDS